MTQTELPSLKPLSEEICAHCGKPLDVQPGQTFTASTDGKVWHYGCAPSRTRTPSPETPVSDDETATDKTLFDETYEIGKRDGYEKAVQDIDLLTGGDGEYRYCMGVRDERHCPDAETMKARIAERFHNTEAAIVLKRYREALEAQGIALAAWVNLLQPTCVTGEDGDPILTGESVWQRDPTRAEVQAALEAQNNAAAALKAGA